MTLRAVGRRGAARCGTTGEYVRIRTSIRPAAGCLALVLVLTGCSGSRNGTTETSPATPAPSGSFVAGGQPSAATPCGITRTPPKYEHVVWVVLENKGPGLIVKSASASYFNELIGKCGYATNAHAGKHPSLPNYIAMTSGSAQEINDNGPPAVHPLNVESIFSQLGPNRWRALAESMPGNCHKTDSGKYVAHHNPPTYYVNISAQCETQDVPLGDTPDISAPFTFIAPNQDNNTHDTNVAAGDAWLKSFMPKILNSPQYRAGKTAAVITFDEDEGRDSQANPIPTLVLSPSTGIGAKPDTHYTHYSLLRTTEELLGLGLLRNASTATSMREGFNL